MSPPDHVKTLIAPEEKVTPGLLYIRVATLSRSLIASNCSMAAFILLPPSLFLLSTYHFLPQTTTNFGSYLHSLEHTYVPTFAHKQDVAMAHTRMMGECMKHSAKNGRAQLQHGTEHRIEQIQNMTGLKLWETLR